MSVPRPAMLVAMVTAARRARLGDDEGFLLVVARIQHVMLEHRPLLQKRGGRCSSDFSIETVPTRHRLAARAGTP